MICDHGRDRIERGGDPVTSLRWWHWLRSRLPITKYGRYFKTIFNVCHEKKMQIVPVFFRPALSPGDIRKLGQKFEKNKMSIP